jgi:hypothetical protein
MVSPTPTRAMFSSSCSLRCWPTSLANEGDEVDRAENGRIALQKIELHFVRSRPKRPAATRAHWHSLVDLPSARGVSERLGSAS